MLSRDYVTHKLIGSSFEGVAKRLRDLTKLPRQIRHPELKEIYVESDRADLVMQRLIDDSMNCIDIGAHLGGVLNRITSLSPHQQHIAIEPIPYKCEWLKQKFPNVSVLEVALSDSAGDVDFYIQPRRSGFSGLNLRGDIQEKTQEIEIIKVKLARLDDIVPDDLSIGFIKIDVEGAELFALRGATRILNSSHPSILFECFPKSFEAHNITALEIYEFFRQHNYSIFLIKDWLSGDKPLDYARFTQVMQYPFQAFNFLAI